MKERPILFNTAMVTAILNGSKTQSRRPIKNLQEGKEYSCDGFIKWSADERSIGQVVFSGEIDDEEIRVKQSYQIGDHLWVRESAKIESWFYDDNSINPFIQYSLFDGKSGSIRLPDRFNPNKRPKWVDNLQKVPNGCIKEMARIWLEITDIRVERVQDISEEDSGKEGIISNKEYEDKAGSEGLFSCPDCAGMQVHGCLGENMGVSECDCHTCDTQKKRFSILWNSIYGNLDCWVWVIEFKRIEK